MWKSSPPFCRWSLCCAPHIVIALDARDSDCFGDLAAVKLDHSFDLCSRCARGCDAWLAFFIHTHRVKEHICFCRCWARLIALIDAKTHAKNNSSQQSQHNHQLDYAETSFHFSPLSPFQEFDNTPMTITVCIMQWCPAIVIQNSRKCTMIY